MKTIEEIMGKLGIEQLNEMQQRSMEAIANGQKDVLVLSPTGSGKTLAYQLPMTRCLDEKVGAVQAVVITPGRELALQSANILNSMGCGLKAVEVYGGRPAMDEHRVMKKVNPHVVFGTPGRLVDHLEKGNINPYGVRMLVIDEFDKCLEMGFLKEMNNLVKLLPGINKRVLLSATESGEIPRFLNMGSVVRIDCRDDNEELESRINIYKVESPEKDKLPTLGRLLCSFGTQSSVVFLNYRNSVDRTADYLHGMGFTLSVMHGGLDQREREDALYKFSNGSANVLVCTDLASRGLDIPKIDNIIHYHLPQREEEYVHRVGRTARWDAMGNTFLLVGPEESVPQFMADEPQAYQIPEGGQKPAEPLMTTIYIGKGKKDKVSKGDILGYLCKKGQLKSGDIGRIDVKERYAYAAIKRGRLDQVLRLTAGERIKGLKTVVEPVK